MFARYYYHTCFLCKKVPEDVRFPVCGRCQLVSYCSKEHQQSDWPRHKVFCKAISCDIEGRKHEEVLQLALLPTKEEKYDYIGKQRFILTKGMEQAKEACANVYQYDAMIYQNRCRMCCVPTPRTKFWCHDCKYTSYCSAEHLAEDKLEHKDECAAIKLCIEFDSFFEEGYSYDNIKFFSGLKLFPLPNDMTQVFKRYSSTYDINQMEQILLSSFASYPLSIAYGMKESNNKALLSKNALDIHMLNDSSIFGRIIKILPFHLMQFWLPKLKKLNILLVTGERDLEEPPPILSLDNYVVSIFKQTLSEYIKARASLIRPDVILCINRIPEDSGIHRNVFAEWMAETCEILFLSLDMCKLEAKRNNPIMLQRSGRREEEAGKIRGNPFKCLRPSRAVNTCTCTVHFENNFITIF